MKPPACGIAAARRIGYLILQAEGAFDIMFTDRERYKWMFAQQSHIKPARR
jgi:hypothetical protein